MDTNHILDFKEYLNNNFEFSDFQNKACNAIIRNEHVLVTAHTGSGKTLPAEFSIYYQIKVLGKKVIYTSPIKALSNQKFQEFSKKFHDISVGILTGDIKHNPDADLLIMTTEILQNNCFKMNNTKSYLDFNIDLENELGSVVFDEVHYIDDPDRGTVWEQSMIMLPNNVPYVMLSATIGEKEVFAKWIEGITNKPVCICSTNMRVVPLQFHEYFTVPEKYVDNIKDKQKKKMFQDKLDNKGIVVKTNKNFNKTIFNNTKKCFHEIKKDNFVVHNKFVVNDCLEHLKQNDRFPAILFVFSRKLVERYASQITTNLFMENEKDYKVEPIFRQMLVSKVNNWKEFVALPEYKTYLDLLEKGIGIHHAGMLPIFRELIEILYDQKYIKILIATETFAIGLNMPTRSVLFSSLFKHDGVSMRQLKSHEFIQMAGRAGRRNIDTVGYVYLLSNLYEPLNESEYYNLFYSTPKILKSRFKIGYNLILNFMNNYDKDEFEKMIKLSLMNLDIKKQIEYSMIEIKKIKTRMESCLSILQEQEWDVISYFGEYEKMKSNISYYKNKEKRKIIKQINEIENDKSKIRYYSTYTNYKNYKIEYNKELDILEYSKNFIKSQVEQIYNILKCNCYVNDEDKLSTIGVNASFIHELPCLVFMDVYEYIFKKRDYNEIDILCILSCFYDIKVSDDKKIHNPPYMKQEVKYINERIDYYIDQELKYEMYISCGVKLQYDLMQNMKDWYENVNSVEEALFFFNNMKNENKYFVGDFIKASMKIINMCNEIKIICENDENYEFLTKINTIQEKIQKNIVSNKSLYI